MREKKPYTNLGGASRISFQYLLKADYKRGQISTFPGHRKNFLKLIYLVVKTETPMMIYELSCLHYNKL